MKVQRGRDGTILNAAVLTADDVAGQRVLCPACMCDVFEKWPDDWDAHAAHRCGGVNDGPAEERKAEFRRVLGHLFRGPEKSGVPAMQLDDFVAFVGMLEGRRVETLGGNEPFRVTVADNGLLYTPERGGRVRLHSYSRVQRYLDEYGRSESLEPAAYQGGRNQPYVLALLALYREHSAVRGAA